MGVEPVRRFAYPQYREHCFVNRTEERTRLITRKTVMTTSAMQDDKNQTRAEGWSKGFSAKSWSFMIIAPVQRPPAEDTGRC